MTVDQPPPSSWDVRRMRAAMLQTMPNLPRALCRTSKDPDLWHPERSTRRQEAEAMRVCMRCHEMLNCLAYAVRAHPISGVWGATTEAQRRTMLENANVRQFTTPS